MVMGGVGPPFALIGRANKGHWHLLQPKYQGTGGLQGRQHNAMYYSQGKRVPAHSVQTGSGDKNTEITPLSQ